MSIDFQRVANIYQQSSLILQSKSILTQNLTLSTKNISETVKNNADINIEYKFNLVTEPLSQSLIRVCQYWQQKVHQLQQYHTIYMQYCKNLKQKSQELKNNTSLLSKQDQLLTEIEAIMMKYQHNEQPLQYFDIRYRKEVRQQITTKLKQIELSSEQTKQSSSPMYTHKLQKQLKQKIYEIHQQQTNNDQNFHQATCNAYIWIKNKISEIGQLINSNSIRQEHIYLQNQMYRFFEQNSEIIEKTKNSSKYQQIIKVMRMQKQTHRIQQNKGLSQKDFNKYYLSLSNKVKVIYQYWQQFHTKIEHIMRVIKQLNQQIIKSQQKFQYTQQLIYHKLQNIPNDIGRIFQVQVIYNLMKKFHENYQLIKIINIYLKKLAEISNYVQDRQLLTQQYLNQISKEIILRTKNMKYYLLEDKKFLEDACKCQQYVICGLVQSTKDVLSGMYIIVKNINKFINTEKKRTIYQQYQISKIINKMIIDDSYLTQNTQHTNRDNSMSRESLLVKSLPSHKRNQKNQKINKIEEFINKIVIIQKQQISLDKQFAVALGPRFLLHGKIFIDSQGIYYQSIFNKRNVFFGKTKLFIERQQILQIDQKNTLYVFPDAIQIKTSKGAIYLHALASRKNIYKTIDNQYFPENNREEVSYISQGDFQYIQKLELNNALDQKLIEPLELLICSHTFPGCKLNKFYRRYYSDDQFQIRGKMYDNFKTYFLQTIEAKDPKSTPLTPEPPAYFAYKNQQSPQILSQFSERLHTYRKAIPKIPFISKGGDGFCQERQTYRWISPQIIIIDSVSVVKGFSLTQGMQILTKVVLKQQNNSVKLQFSATVTFSTQSSTNNLLKTPALSNLKSATTKMIQIIQKYQKGKKSKKQQPSNQLQQDPSIERIEGLIGQNQKLRKKIKYMGIGFIIIYFVTIILINCL